MKQQTKTENTNSQSPSTHAKAVITIESQPALPGPSGSGGGDAGDTDFGTTQSLPKVAKTTVQRQNKGCTVNQPETKTYNHDIAYTSSAGILFQGRQPILGQPETRTYNHDIAYTSSAGILFQGRESILDKPEIRIFNDDASSAGVQAGQCILGQQETRSIRFGTANETEARGSIEGSHSHKQQADALGPYPDQLELSIPLTESRELNPGQTELMFSAEGRESELENENLVAESIIYTPTVYRPYEKGEQLLKSSSFESVPSPPKSAFYFDYLSNLNVLLPIIMYGLPVAASVLALPRIIYGLQTVASILALEAYLPYIFPYINQLPGSPWQAPLPFADSPISDNRIPNNNKKFNFFRTPQPNIFMIISWLCLSKNRMQSIFTSMHTILKIFYSKDLAFKDSFKLSSNNLELENADFIKSKYHDYEIRILGTGELVINVRDPDVTSSLLFKKNAGTIQLEDLSFFGNLELELVTYTKKVPMPSVFESNNTWSSIYKEISTYNGKDFVILKSKESSYSFQVCSVPISSAENTSTEDSSTKNNQTKYEKVLVFNPIYEGSELLLEVSMHLRGNSARLFLLTAGEKAEFSALPFSGYLWSMLITEIELLQDLFSEVQAGKTAWFRWFFSDLKRSLAYEITDVVALLTRSRSRLE